MHARPLDRETISPLPTEMEPERVSKPFIIAWLKDAVHCVDVG